MIEEWFFIFCVGGGCEIPLPSTKMFQDLEQCQLAKEKLITKNKNISIIQPCEDSVKINHQENKRFISDKFEAQ